MQLQGKRKKTSSPLLQSQASARKQTYRSIVTTGALLSSLARVYTPGHELKTCDWIVIKGIWTRV